MTDLIVFLRARIDRDEQVARAVKPAANLHPADPIKFILSANDLTSPDIEAAEQHITHFDPARMLREVAAKRSTIESCRWWWDRQPEADAELHRRFAHPDYEYATTEGPRKAWDEASEPPYGDDGDPDHTWERNVDAGRDGWERFDHTEESYWRRRLPEAKARESRARRDRPPMELRALASVWADHPDYDEAWRL